MGKEMELMFVTSCVLLFLISNNFAILTVDYTFFSKLVKKNEYWPYCDKGGNDILMLKYMKAVDICKNMKISS